MKKIIGIILSLTLCMVLLASCQQKSADSDKENLIPEIGKNQIYKVNSRKNLAKNNGTVLEETKYYFDDFSKNRSWKLMYEKNGDSMNVSVSYGDDYKCYYKDGKIFLLDYGENYYQLIPFKQSYDEAVNEILMGNNFLKGVYITSQHTEKKDNGYIVTFGFTITNDTVSDFSDWDIKLNQTMSVVYELNDKLEIQNYKYYYLDKNIRKLLVEVNYIYGVKPEYPTDVINKSESKDNVKLTIVQNYGRDSEYKEEFDVARGTKIYGNNYIIERYLYTDPKGNMLWNYGEVINQDTVLYLAG